jgi:hypothetical protein
VRLRKYAAIEIRWIDSERQEFGWTRQSDVDSLEIREATTIGYFVDQDAKVIRVAQSKTDEEDPQLDALMTIPKCAISNIKRI